jgi:hypothetical protein
MITKVICTRQRHRPLQPLYRPHRLHCRPLHQHLQDQSHVAELKKIQQEVRALLCELKLNSNDNFMLPKSCMLILLRYVDENHQYEGHEARIGKVLVIQQGHSAISRFRQSIRQFPEA